MQLSPARQGFRLPANPDPPDYLCVTVPIPNDPAHVSAFLGVMYDLTVWLSWQSDAAHTAIKASTVWKRIFIQIQDEIGKCHTSGEQVVMMEDFMSICQQLRIHNGVLQGLCCFDPTTGEASWEDIQGGEGGFLPAGATQPGASPRPAAGASKCYTVLLNANSQWILPFAVNDGDQITISEVAGVWTDGALNWYCPDGTPFILGACVGAQGHAGGDPDSTDFHMQAIAQIGPLFYPASGGTFTVPGGTGAQSLILLANDGTPSDNRGSVSLKICVENGGAPPVTTWCYVFDFTLNDYSSLYEIVPTYNGIYTVGVGYESQPSGGGNEDLLLRMIAIPAIPGGAYVSVEVQWTSTGNDGSGNLYQYPGAVDHPPNNTGTNTATYSEAPVAGRNFDQQPAGAEHLVITRHIWRGTGVNPFGSSNC